MPDISAEKLVSWIGSCFDDNLIGQVDGNSDNSENWLLNGYCFTYIAPLQARENSIPMFEGMGGREGLIHFLDTSLESGLPSAEVISSFCRP